MYKTELSKIKLWTILKTMTGFELTKILVSGLIASTISIISSALVNTTLVEISLSAFFAFYFGICFQIIGFVLMIQVNQMQNSDEMKKRKPFLYLFSILVVFSGFFCLFLEEHWCKKLRYGEKIPLYMIIAISLNFSILFCIIDLLNFFLGFCQKQWQKSMVETPKQIILLLTSSVIMGLYYGFCFGINDIEDKRGRTLDIRLIQEEYQCIPIAGFIGLIGGIFNEIIRIKGDYVPLLFSDKEEEDPFNEEISSQHQSFSVDKKDVVL